jgi:hypothetical protein
MKTPKKRRKPALVTERQKARQFLLDFLHEISPNDRIPTRAIPIAIYAIVVLRDDLLTWAREKQNA